MLHHETGCRSHNTGCDGDCDCRSFAELNTALNQSSAPADVDEAINEEEQEEPMNYCSDCGWSGREFHACDGVPGGFGDND